MAQHIPVHKIEDRPLFIKWRDIKVLPDSIEHAHRHNYYQLMIFDEAAGAHEIDFENYPCLNKSFHFVGKGRVHKVNFKTGLKGGVFLFPAEIFDSSEHDLHLLASFSFFRINAIPILELNDEQYRSIKELVNRVKAALKEDSFEVGKYLFFALLCQIRAIYSANTKGYAKAKIPKEIIEFNKILAKTNGKIAQLEDVVEKLGVTAARLNSLTKKTYGKTALRVLKDRQLLAAKRLLVYTNKQVKEIAYDCGFDDVAYFNRFFKKYTNQTPIAFRKSHEVQ